MFTALVSGNDLVTSQKNHGEHMGMDMADVYLKVRLWGDIEISLSSCLVVCAFFFCERTCLDWLKVWDIIIAIICDLPCVAWVLCFPQHCPNMPLSRHIINWSTCQFLGSFCPFFYCKWPNLVHRKQVQLEFNVFDATVNCLIAFNVEFADSPLEVSGLSVGLL